MLDRREIFTRYPWLKPHTEPERVVIGDDLDAVLSAVLYLTHHPNARLTGVYHQYTTVHYASTLTWEEALCGVWLDLDIRHPACRSLGHHVVRLSPADQLPELGAKCNLNELVGRSVQGGFIRKYPLGTVHFLMWLYDVDLPPHPDAELLIWLADSTYINAQARSWRRDWKRKEKVAWKERNGFRWNVEAWLRELMPHPPLLQTLETVERRAFEERMVRFQQEVLARRCLEQGTGQAASRHLQLHGYQCQPPEAVDMGNYLRNLLALIVQYTRWRLEPAQIAPLRSLKSRTGRRTMVPVREVQREGLARFLKRNQVFSYVFQSKKTLNYTTGL